MPFRLLLARPEGDFEFLLRRGENLIGADASCDIVAEHPTVSRHHASLIVVPVDGAEFLLKLADLGSRNGTWLAGERVGSEALVAAPSPVRFGSLEGRVVWIDAGDASPARIASRPPNLAELEAPVQAAGRATTASAGPLFRFTLGYLPELLRAAVAGPPRHAVVSRLAAALAECLPCERLEILQAGASGDSVLSTLGASVPGQRGAESGDWTEVVSEHFRVRVVFRSVEMSRLYRPLLDVAAHMLELMFAPHSSPIERPGAAVVGEGEGMPRPPDPPSADPEVRQVYKKARQVAAGDVHVLVLGESGTGKELLARFVHDSSARRSGPWVTLNCAALPRDLQESELFGIERGVATGVEARAGRFEEAHGGTLFLDEIGDMALDVQAKILRVLQEKAVYRLGGSKARPADVRILSATHRDLQQMLKAESFRIDLYHRIADWEVRLPALRHRVADLANLASYFLAEAGARAGRPTLAFSEAALDAILRYSWPGNVRQLEREISTASLFVPEGGLLTTEHLADHLVEADGVESTRSLRSAVAAAEKRSIRSALRAVDGDVPAAARILEVPESTLYRKIKRHDL